MSLVLQGGSSFMSLWVQEGSSFTSLVLQGGSILHLLWSENEVLLRLLCFNPSMSVFFSVTFHSGTQKCLDPSSKMGKIVEKRKKNGESPTFEDPTIQVLQDLQFSERFNVPFTVFLHRTLTLIILP